MSDTPTPEQETDLTLAARMRAGSHHVSYPQCDQLRKGAERIEALAAALEAVTEERDRFRRKLDATQRTLTVSKSKAALLREWTKERDRLREALRFYADDINYEFDGPDHDSAVQADTGEVARAALEGIRGRIGA